MRERGLGFDAASRIFEGDTLEQIDDRHVQGKVRSRAIGLVDEDPVSTRAYRSGCDPLDHFGSQGEPKRETPMERSIASIRAARPTVARTAFDATSEADIRRHGLEDGEASPDGSGEWRLSVHPTRLRERLGLSTEAFAAALGIPDALVRDWDEGRILPDPASRSLLAAVSRDPDTVLRLIAGRAA